MEADMDEAELAEAEAALRGGEEGGVEMMRDDFVVYGDDVAPAVSQTRGGGEGVEDASDQSSRHCGGEAG
jgi:hypothetical protein